MVQIFWSLKPLNIEVGLIVKELAVMKSINLRYEHLNNKKIIT